MAYKSVYAGYANEGNCRENNLALNGIKAGESESLDELDQPPSDIDRLSELLLWWFHSKDVMLNCCNNPKYNE